MYSNFFDNRVETGINAGHKNPGIFFVISAPSGTGKTSLIKALLRDDDTIVPSISMTTRPMRSGECEGKDYFFVDQASFNRHKAAKDLLEYAEVFNHSYGTPRAYVGGCINRGLDVVCDVDWQGAQYIREKYTGPLITIFIFPPDLVTLSERLNQRGQDKPDVIASRLEGARTEMAHWSSYDEFLINDCFDAALERLKSIIHQARVRHHMRYHVSHMMENFI